MADVPGVSHGFPHHALIHSSDDDLIGGLRWFVRDGLVADQPVVAAVSDRTATLLSDALGPDRQRLRFLDAAAVYENPRKALRNFEALLKEDSAADADCVHLVGEIPFGAIASAQREWMRYESALNSLLAHAPVRSVCTYDRRTLPAEVVASAARTHPLLATPAGWCYSDDYLPPARFLPELTAWERSQASLLTDLTVGRDLSRVRGTVRRHATAQGAAPERLDQFVNAVNEVVTNAVTHGQEPVRLRLLADEHMLMCRISDCGTGLDDPLAAYRLPATNEEQEGGRGLWLARELCDVVELESRPDGFAVHLAMNMDQGSSGSTSADEA